VALPIDVYTLPGGADVPPPEIQAQYANGSFPEAVRDWHLDRIPRLTIAAVTYILCPWCGKNKDSRSMQIDHIIPVRIYARYQLYIRRDDVGGSGQHSRDRADAALRNAYNDTNNLLLCCMRCNSGAQATMPTTLSLGNARGRVAGTDLAMRLLELTTTLMRINSLPMHVAGVNVRAYVLGGPTWRTSLMSSRFDPIGASSDLKEKLTNIENVISTFLIGRRIPWTVTAAQLQATQTAQVFNNQEGRLCFYCLGLFKKQAFQLDHIPPASTRAATAAVYNDPTNLIPVCRTCNTAKGNFSLTTGWLDQQILDRQTAGLPGVENATGVVAPPLHANYLEYARAQRLRVLGH